MKKNNKKIAIFIIGFFSTFFLHPYRVLDVYRLPVMIMGFLIKRDCQKIGVFASECMYFETFTSLVQQNILRKAIQDKQALIQAKIEFKSKLEECMGFSGDLKLGSEKKPLFFLWLDMGRASYDSYESDKDASKVLDAIRVQIDPLQ